MSPREPWKAKPPQVPQEPREVRERDRKAWKADPAVHEPPTAPCGGGRRVLPLIEGYDDE